jgi:glutamate mutase epsilon subunit
MRYLAAFHRANIAEREKTRGKKLDYEILVSDLFAVSKGVFVE